MNYILAAIFSNLSYAVADNFNGLAAKKNSPIKLAFWAALSGVVIFFVPMVLFFQNEIAKLTLENIAIILALDVLVSLGYLTFLMGMSKGSVTLTGVIGGSFPVVTTIVALLFFGETVSSSQAMAIVVILLGIMLSSLEGSIKTLLRDIKSSAIIYAFATFFLWGVYFALIRIAVERVGWFIPQYASAVFGMIIYFLLSNKLGEKEITKKPNLMGLIIIIAILQISGSMFYNYALTKGPTSVVAPIAGSSPAVFVIIAFFLFKERLKKIQLLGIFLAVSGIIGLSILS